ncbi:MAG: response regulator transcription factor [Lacisediminimonas sp.]|nr:response regulator transcription factor [Lacisediminimonas sp.]
MNIIVVEDNDELRDATVDALRVEGHQVLGLDCAEALPEQASWRRIDLMLVDLNLPGEDGLALTQRVRAIQPDIGIIMVTARGLSNDKRRGYDSGADIYMTKPVSLEELTAAIQSLSRRLKPEAAPMARLTLDLGRRVLRCRDQTEVLLTSHESALLAALSRAAECRLETWQLIDILEKDSAEDPKAAVEILIARLRKKLLQAGCTELAIKSIRSWGYQMSAQLQLV